MASIVASVSDSAPEAGTARCGSHQHHGQQNREASHDAPLSCRLDGRSSRCEVATSTPGGIGRRSPLTQPVVEHSKPMLSVAGHFNALGSHGWQQPCLSSEGSVAVSPHAHETPRHLEEEGHVARADQSPRPSGATAVKGESYTDKRLQGGLPDRRESTAFLGQGSVAGSNNSTRICRPPLPSTRFGRRSRSPEGLAVETDLDHR